jgi:DNA-binding winged helix-turn-helix (wHTH) protein
MDRDGSSDGVLFEGFRLDRRGGVLFRLDQRGMAAPVALGTRALNLLGLLVDRKGELVSKDAIMAAVWPGRVVEEANLNSIGTENRAAASRPYPAAATALSEH